jgi:hypothetical protein
MKKHLIIQQGFTCDPATGFWFNRFRRKGINERAIRKALIEEIRSWLNKVDSIGARYDFVASPILTSRQMDDVVRRLGW